MSQRIQKIENKTVVWNINLRPRVGDSVTHNSNTYTNLTGKNTEPGVGVDWFNTTNNESLINQITITTSLDITTNTLDSNGLGQSGRNTVIDNAGNNINLTVESVDGFISSYLKHGTGDITFVQGSGRTLVNVDGTAVLDGGLGSTAVVSSVGTVDYLRISNI